MMKKCNNLAVYGCMVLLKMLPLLVSGYMYSMNLLARCMFHNMNLNKYLVTTVVYSSYKNILDAAYIASYVAMTKYMKYREQLLYVCTLATYIICSQL